MPRIVKTSLRLFICVEGIKTPGLGGLGKGVFPEENCAMQPLASPSLKAWGILAIHLKLVIRISTELQRTHRLVVSDSHFKLHEWMNTSKNKWRYGAAYTLRFGQWGKWGSVSQGQSYITKNECGVSFGSAQWDFLEGQTGPGGEKLQIVPEICGVPRLMTFHSVT